MDSIYKYSPYVEYKPNNGNFYELLKAKDLYKQTIVVSDDDDKSFHVTFPNIFVQYLFKKTVNWHDNPFKFWQTQLNFAIFCASTACGVSSEILTNDKHLLVMSVYRFHVYYYIRRILKRLQVPLPFESGFHQYDNPYNKKEFLQICNEYNLEPNEYNYVNGFLYTTYFKNRSKPITNDSITRWIIEKSRGFTRSGLVSISESVRAYVYLILNSQTAARSSIIGNNSNALTAQREFINNFENIINRRVDIQEDIARYQNTLNYASSKVDYSVGEGIYMLPSDMNLKIKSGVTGYNNKILISSNLNLGVNKKVNVSQKLHRENKLVNVSKKKHKELVKKQENDTLISHEDEKIALILFCTTVFTVWYMFK